MSMSDEPKKSGIRRFLIGTLITLMIPPVLFGGFFYFFAGSNPITLFSQIVGEPFVIGFWLIFGLFGGLASLSNTRGRRSGGGGWAGDGGWGDSGGDGGGGGGD